MQYSVEELISKINSKKINLNENDIIERLIDRHRWPLMYHTGHPTLERIDNTGRKWQDFYAQDGWPDTDRVLDLYNQGYTFILSGIQSFNSEILEITKLISQHFNIYVNANMYIGKGLKSISFDKHWHEYSVIVKNVFGESGWIIDQKYFKLTEQNSVYIPAHTDHQVIEIFDVKATITFNIWTSQQNPNFAI